MGGEFTYQPKWDPNHCHIAHPTKNAARPPVPRNSMVTGKPKLVDTCLDLRLGYDPTTRWFSAKEKWNEPRNDVGLGEHKFEF